MKDLRDALLQGRNRPRFTGTGSPALYRGDGYEFVELRAYVPGDDPRRIDWAATARAGQPQTRVVLEDVALTLAAAIDDSASMRLGVRRPLLDAAMEAARAWYGAAAADDRCMRISADGLSSNAGLRGRRGALACANLPPSQHAFFLPAVLDIALAALARASALLVVSDFYDLTAQHEAVLSAMGRRFDCTALIVRDPWYDGLPLGGFVRVSDAESGTVRRVFLGTAERRSYRRAAHERERALRAKLASHNWRAGILREADGAHGLYEAFGLR